MFMFSVLPSSTFAQTSTVKITFWYTENSSEEPGVLRLVKEFETANPTINVKAEAKGFFSAKETYLTQFSAQLEPTVFRAARDWVVEFAQQGLIQPITPYLNATDKKDFIADALRLVSYPDKSGTEQIWGWPQLVDVPALFYNKHTLENAGINTTKFTLNTSLTWSQFTNYTKQIWDKQLKNPEGKPVYGLTLQGMFFGAQPIYYGHGARFFKNDNVSFANIDINSTESRTALTFLKDVVTAPYTPPWDQQGWSTINPMFTTGQVGFIQQGPWELKNFLTNAPEFNKSAPGSRTWASASNLGIMRLPHDEQGHEGAPLGGHAYVITKRATGAVAEAAMKFSRFMSSAHAMAEAAISYYHVPARESVFKDPAVTNSPAWTYIKAIKGIIDRAYKNPVDPKWAQLETVFGTELDNYLAGNETLSQFIDVVTTFWSDILVSGGTGTPTSKSTINPGDFQFIVVPILLVSIPVIQDIKRRKSKKK